jgi:hypothetical protein
MTLGRGRPGRPGPGVAHAEAPILVQNPDIAELIVRAEVRQAPERRRLI